MLNRTYLNSTYSDFATDTFSGLLTKTEVKLGWISYQKLKAVIDGPGRTILTENSSWSQLGKLIIIIIKWCQLPYSKI